MFGIVFLLFTAVCTVCYWISVAIKDHDDVVCSKEVAKELGMDKRLCGDNRTWCDLKTNQHYTVERNLRTGDMEKISTTGKVLENLTETKRQQFKADRIAKSGDSKYYVESVWRNNDRLYPHRRRTYEQEVCRATRVVNKETGVDYFRARRGDVYFYQDIDTARFVDWEIVPEAKGNKEIRAITKDGMKFIPNKPEEIEKECIPALDEDVRQRLAEAHKFYNGEYMRNARIWG